MAKFRSTRKQRWGGELRGRNVFSGGFLWLHIGFSFVSYMYTQLISINDVTGHAGLIMEFTALSSIRFGKLASHVCAKMTHHGKAIQKTICKLRIKTSNSSSLNLRWHFTFFMILILAKISNHELL